MAPRAPSRSRPRAATTRGCTPASITIVSAPSPRRLTSAAAWLRATAKRDGDTSVAFIEAEVSSTTTTLRAPWPMTVATGRARATLRASRARSWRSRSGSRCRRWKNAEASRSRREDSHSKRLDTVRSRRRTLRKYSSTRGSDSAKVARASGERKLMGQRSRQHEALELGQHELLHGGVGDHAVVADLLHPAEGLGFLQELAQAVAVVADGLAVHGELAHLARLAVEESKLSRQLRVHLLGIEEVDDMDVEAALEERAQSRLVAGGIEEIGEDDGQAGLARAQGVVGQRRVEPGAAVGAQVREEIDQGDELVAPPRGRPSLAPLLAQDADPHPLEIDQAHEPQAGGRPRGVGELARRAEAHGGRAVEDEVQTQVFLVDEELHVEAVETTVDVPVHVAEVVAGPVGAVVAELDAVALARTPPLALHATPERAAGGEGEPLELGKELGGEEVLPDRRGHRGYLSSRAWK